MNKLRTKLILPALAVLALSLSSCSGSFWIALGFGIGSDMSGKVVDARGLNTSFSGATVTLTNIDKGNVYHATVDSSGNWSVGGLKTGSYTVSVSLSGNYFFTPLTSTISYSGSPITAPTIAGVYTGNLSNTVFILMWNNTQQLNLYLTAPDGTYTYTTAGLGAIPTLTFTTPSYGPSYDSTTPFLTYWNNGFGPNGSPPTPLGRAALPALSGFSSITYATLSANTASGYGPVAITLGNATLTNNNGFTLLAGSTAAPSGSTNWQGVLDFYIDAPTAGQYISTSGSSTDATLYAVSANASGNPSVLGVYKVPTNSYVKTVQALRINVFDNAYQLVPEMTLVSPEGFRTVAGTTSDGVVTVPRGPAAK